MKSGQKWENPFIIGMKLMHHEKLDSDLFSEKLIERYTKPDYPEIHI